MSIPIQLEYLDLSQLRQISRGERSRSLRYLHQFQELIPSRLDLLESARQQEDRKGIRQVVHQMRPQLQFFGVSSFLPDLPRLETEYETLDWEYLNEFIQRLQVVLGKALEELARVVQFLHDNPDHPNV